MIVHPNFDPVAISIGPVSVHWYGLMYLAALLCGLWLGQIRARRTGSGWDPEEIFDLVFYFAIGMIVGGRLGSVLFYNLPFYLQNPLQVFSIWDGGMSFHGGLIGVIAAFWYYAYKTDRGLLDVADFVAPLVPTGLLFGRFGNFINQELWGRVTDVPWGVMFYSPPGGSEFLPGGPRHPSQLYEAGLEGLVLFLLLWWYASTPRSPGRVSGFFLLGYGCFRFLVEFVREPDAHIGSVLFDWVSMGQILSLPMIVGGAWLMFRRGSAPRSGSFSDSQA